MTENHQRRPIFLQDEYGNIGEPPSSARVGQPTRQLYQYLKNWLQTQQIVCYSAPQTGAGDSIARDGAFYVMLHGPVKDDTSNPTRQLGGYLLPWYCEPDIVGGSIVTPVRIKWQESGGAAQTLVSCSRTISFGATPGWNGGWELITNADADFSYTPDAGGLWTYGVLTTENIRTAALGIWTMPDWELTDAQAVTTANSMAPGNYIEGYASGRRNLGNLIHNVVIESSAWTSDTIERNSMRCIFQCCHPIGWWSDTAAYTDLGPDGTTYKIRVPEYYSYTDDEINLYPTVIAEASGASGGTPAYVKLTSSTAADTWTLPITADALALYDYTDASSDKLTVDASAAEDITIEIKPPAVEGGEILLRSVALWAHAVMTA